MNALSLYSGGCDALSLAGSWVGIESVAFCECDRACREQLRRRHPGTPIFEYDTEVTCDALGEKGIKPDDIDIILASPPCQCASVAGARLGDADERNRWPECLRILRDVGPRWFMAENVPGLLSVNAGRLFETILGELAEMGYDAAWCVYGAADVGAPHQRDRLCLMAYRKGPEQNRPVENEHQAGRRRFADGGDVGDDQSVGRSSRRSECEGRRGESEPSFSNGMADTRRGATWPVWSRPLHRLCGVNIVRALKPPAALAAGAGRGDCNEEENGDVQIDNADLFHVTRQSAFLDNIARRLQLPAMEDLPDVRKVAGKLKEDGDCICYYCKQLDCRMCMIEEALRDE